MNLHESIRRILREENVKRYILRRYDFEELESILQDKLDVQSRNFEHYKNKTFNFFMNSVLKSISNKIMEELTDGWVEDSPISEESLYKFLKNKYEHKIEERFIEINK